MEKCPLLFNSRHMHGEDYSCVSVCVCECVCYHKTSHAVSQNIETSVPT